MAVSVFSEIERADIKSEVVSTDPATSQDVIETKTFSLTGTQRFRLTLRPTVVLRPTSGVQISLNPYFKLPLDRSRQLDVQGEQRLDFRRDIQTRLTWTLQSDDTGAENVGVVFKFDHYFDNLPPSMPAELVAKEKEAGRQLKRTAAEGAHRLFSLELKVSWGS